MDSSVVEDKRQLFDGVDFVDFLTIESCKDSVNSQSLIVCQESEVFHDRISKQVEDMHARLQFAVEEVIVYEYIFFVFRRIFDKFSDWIDQADGETERVPFDSHSIFEEIILEYPFTESEELAKYDVLGFFDRIFSDSLRFPTVFYHRFWMELYHKQETEKELAYDNED